MVELWEVLKTGVRPLRGGNNILGKETPESFFTTPAYADRMISRFMTSKAGAHQTPCRELGLSRNSTVTELVLRIKQGLRRLSNISKTTQVATVNFKI